MPVFESVQYSFRFGDYSSSYLKNARSALYGQFYTASENIVNDLQGTARKRTSIKESSLIEFEITEGRVFTYNIQDKKLFIVGTNGTEIKTFIVKTDDTVEELQNNLPTAVIGKFSELIFSYGSRGGVLAHPLSPPKLVTTAVDTFEFLYGPVKDREEETATLTVSAYGDLGSDVTVTSSENLFNADQVGGVWSVTEPTGTLGAYFEWESGQVIAIGDFRRLEERLYRAEEAGTTGNIPPIHEEDGDIRSDGGVNWLFVNFGTGYFKLKTYTSPTIVIGTIQRLLPPQAVTVQSSNWAEGAFSASAGYPAYVTFLQKRLIFANTKTATDFVFASAIDDAFSYDTFIDSDTLKALSVNRLASLAPASFTSRISVSGSTQIYWIKQVNSKTFVGTENSIILWEFVGSLAAGPSSSSGSVSRQQPTSVNQYIIFSNGIKRIKALATTDAWEGVRVMDVSKTAHESMVDIKELATVSSPDTVFCLKEDEIIFKSFDEEFSVDSTGGLEIYGIGRIVNATIKFLSIATVSEDLYILLRANDKTYIGKYSHYDNNKEDVYTDLNSKEAYTAELILPRPSVLVPPNWLGGIKPINNVSLRLEYADTESFIITDPAPNSLEAHIALRSAETPLKDRDFKTGEQITPVSNDGRAVKLFSPSGKAFKVVGGVFSFMPST